MSKVKVYNKQGKESGDMSLQEEIFSIKTNKHLVHEVYIALEANTRQPWAHAKDRSEVRGGGKKPWQQKGTGRARHGSIRSPIWTGGGVTFGPLKTRNYKKKVNKKSARRALAMCLSEKLANDKLIIVDDLSASGKTKEMAEMRKSLPGYGKSTLIISENNNEALLLATRNIPRVHVQRAQDLNVADLLHHQFIITSKKGVEALQDRLV